MKVLRNGGSLQKNDGYLIADKRWSPLRISSGKLNLGRSRFWGRSREEVVMVKTWCKKLLTKKGNGSPEKDYAVELTFRRENGARKQGIRRLIAKSAVRAVHQKTYAEKARAY